ncbi:PspC domain-containing protein [Cellulomonas endometrii]|uniref:PspC domain-containing protein n=1 Tax=Cellulomonas endometrii TaxID=3036301 RepID=UPI0024ACD504|nr:PspC domain-containing protein [Cellulomonas endometrii]
MTGIYESMWRNGLVRPLDGRVLGGVCAGLARRFGIDPWPMRWLFLIVLIVLPGSPLLIYPLLWIFMPGEDWVARVHGPSAYGQAYPGGPRTSQPYAGASYPAQSYAAQSYPGQPYAAQPDPAAQPYPAAGDEPPAPQTPADGPR